MKKTIILTALLCAATLTGCYRDLGNYDYSPINEVTISGLPEETVFAFRNVDQLNITPTIESTHGVDPSNYTYLWQAVVSQGSVDGKTFFPIGEELTLDYFIQLPEAEYTVYLEVTDNTTGVMRRAGFPLKVTTSLYEGWLILSEVDGFCHLDMISLSGAEELVVRDIWNGTHFAQMKGPRQLIFQPDLYQNHGVYLMTDDGTVRLNGDDFSYDEANEIIYELGKYDAGFRPQALTINYMDAINVCVAADGNVYTKNGMASGALYGIPVNKIEGEDDFFSVAPAIGMPKYAYAMSPTIIMYDQTNRRFVQLLSNLRGMRMPTAPETVFSYNTGKEFVYMGNGLQDNGTTFTILKDDAGKLWLYGMKVQAYSSLAQLPAYHYRLDAPQIESATAFAVHPLLYHLFYAVENRIYQYDMINKTCRILPMTLTEGSVDELAGEEITMLKFNIFGLGEYSKPAGSADMQYRLMVGSRATDGRTMPGTLRMLDIPTATDRPAELYKSYSGLGTVVDVTYRERR